MHAAVGSVSTNATPEPVRRMPQADAVVDAIGAFGPWQAPGLFLLALVKIPAGWHMLSVLFLAPQPETFGGQYWCARPDPGIALQQWIESRHPKSKKYLNGYDPCYVFTNEEPEDSGNEDKNIYQSAANNFSLSACESFEFKMPRQTMVSEFSLVCDRDVLVNVIQLCYLLGILFGGIFTYLLQKRLSPRIILLSGATLQVAAGIGSALVPLYEQHCVLKFLTGLGVCLMFTSGFQISLDITSGWQRTTVGVCYEHFWSIGVISLGWLHQLTESWRILQLAISAPTIIILLFFWAVPESPRWLIAHGRAAQAEEILRAAAIVNGQKLSRSFSVQNSNSRASKSEASLPKLKIFCSQILWIITIFNYYGALLNIRNVAGTSLAIRTTLAGGAELIGASIGLYLLLWSKHKFGFLSALLLIGGTCCISSWALPTNERGNRGSWAMIWLALTGRVSIACSLAMISNGATSDFLPVPKRPFVMMVFVSTGRLCLQGAPFMNSLAKIADSITLSIYGSLAVIGSLAAFLLFLQNECGGRKKPKRRLTNLMHSPRSRVWHVHQNCGDGGASCPDTSTYTEAKIIGVNFNPCFVDDNGRPVQYARQAEVANG